MRKAMHLMGVLEDTDIEWIAVNGRVRTVRSGETLIQAGQPVDSLFFLLEGRLVVQAAGVQVATLQSGEVVGEISFVDSRAPLADVSALDTCQILALPRGDLQRKLDRDTAFASRFFRALAAFLADRLRLTTGRLGYGDARQDQTEADEMDLEMMETVGVGASRFDRFMSRLLRGGSPLPNGD